MMKVAFSFLLSACVIFSLVSNAYAATVSATPPGISGMAGSSGASGSGAVSGSGAGSATDAGSIVMDALVDQFGFVVDRARVPEDAEVLITLSASNGGTIGLVNVYTRQTRGEMRLWVKELETAAVHGANGIYKTRQGDKKTPVGTFKMNTPFGIKAREEGFPENYIQVDAGYYWDGDSESTQYNKLVHTSSYSDFNKSASEHLINYTGYYDYAIDIGYNADCTPYLGSAIFLHCFVQGDFDTAGCVAVPEDQMIRIMQLYREGKTWMVIYDVGNPEGVY